MSTVKGNSKKRFAESEKGKRVADDMDDDMAREYAHFEETYNSMRNDDVMDLMFKVYKDNPNLPEIYRRYCEGKAVVLQSWEAFRPTFQRLLSWQALLKTREKKEKGMISDHGKKRRSNRIAENESKKKEKGMISEHGKKRRSNRIAENESKKKKNKQDDLPKPGQAPRPVGASIHART